MSAKVELLEATVSSIISRQKHPTPEQIREAISGLRMSPLFAVDDLTAEEVARRLEVRHSVTMGIGQVLKDQDYEPWLDSVRADIDPYYWGRYSHLLRDSGLSNHVIATVDDVTERTLGLLENPHKEGPWDRRGMVVGHVQSGKTANYVGLVAKAADAGYMLIVIIAGIHNNLRNQTQSRVDEGFIGIDSARLLNRKEDRYVGVGKLNPQRAPVPFTNSQRDFNKATATSVGIPLRNLKEPAVFVIKKNSSTLRNLLEWLKEYNALGSQETIDIPMLLIDDEADNASVNTSRKPNEASRINSQIRDLLKVFDRSCYIGYTATPFANIFIDPTTDDEMLGEDLFPKNFIISLDPPSNYFGPDKVFAGENESNVIQYIEDNDGMLPVKQSIDMEVNELPDSLMEAIRTFVVARAIRLHRGHKQAHTSMMVNASRFTGVQSRLRNEIHHRVKRIQESVRMYGSLGTDQALRYPELSALYAVWQKQYPNAEASWEQVQTYLHDAVAPITVVEVNSRSAGKLNYSDYENGLCVIAVGGYSLSRGLTLEGLMVSYFLRNSVMYDTLMQMGRWFGYRPGYEDLCRVWMPEEAEGWYAHISESIEILRSELRNMERVNATPEEFGLKVRAHPDTLMVTARNKMGASEKIVVSVGLGNSFVETAILRDDTQAKDLNRQAARKLVERLAVEGFSVTSGSRVNNGWLVRFAPVMAVLDFVSAFRNHPMSMNTDSDLVRPYVEGRIDELHDWDILFTSVRESDVPSLVDHSLGFEIHCQRRSAGERTEPGKRLYITNKQRVASRGAERTGLTEAQIVMVQKQYLEDDWVHLKQTAKPNFPDRIYRSARNRPLLMVHLLAIGPDNTDLSESLPVIAWSISFPQTKTPEKRVQYVVNTSWMRDNYQDEFEDEEMDDVSF